MNNYTKPDTQEWYAEQKAAAIEKAKDETIARQQKEIEGLKNILDHKEDCRLLRRCENIAESKNKEIERLTKTIEGLSVIANQKDELILEQLRTIESKDSVIKKLVEALEQRGFGYYAKEIIAEAGKEIK